MRERERERERERGAFDCRYQKQICSDKKILPSQILRLLVLREIKREHI